MASTAPTSKTRDARGVAADVLRRVLSDDAYAAAALDAELARAPMDARDRALATEIVYGSLRARATLDARIARHLARDRAPDEVVRAHLLVGAYQLLFLERTPAYAVVDAAVRAVTAARGKGPGGFVNAVLRKIAREADAGDRPDPSAAFRASLPAWLTAAIDDALGASGGAAFLASTSTPPLGLFVFDAARRDEWIERISSAVGDATVAAGTASPNAILVRGGGRPDDLPGLHEAWTVQEEGSQVVALAVGAKPGESIVDACAGRGNKSVVLARGVGGTGRVVAVDAYPSKLARAQKAAAAMGLAIETKAIDGSVGVGDLPEASFDAVLVDAPCSGVGTIRRRPDLLLRRTEADVAALVELQTKIATNAARLVKPGGRLVYAVCSVLRAEAEGVVARLLATTAATGLEPAPFVGAPARAIAGDSASMRLLPYEHGTDGYFLAAFRKGR